MKKAIVSVFRFLAFREVSFTRLRHITHLFFRGLRVPLLPRGELGLHRGHRGGRGLHPGRGDVLQTAGVNTGSLSSTISSVNFPLCSYISGDNEDNQTMDMTVPISYRMVETAEQVTGARDLGLATYLPWFRVESTTSGCVSTFPVRSKRTLPSPVTKMSKL